MVQAINVFAMLAVLVVSSAWANESNKEQADQLKKLLGTWEFFVEIPGTGRTNQWYQFNKIDFLPEGTPILLGNTPLTKSLMVVVSKKSTRGDTFSMEQVEEVGKEGLLCMTFIFTPGPINHWSSELFIQGDVGMTTGIKKRSQDNSGYSPECFFDEEITLKGTFTGLRR